MTCSASHWPQRKLHMEARSRESRMAKLLSTIFIALFIGGSAWGVSIDPENRWQVRDFYKAVFLATELTDSQWTGNYDTGDSGRVSEEWLEATLARVNYFRSMAGVPGKVTFDGEMSSASQQAALMLSVRGQLSHNPDETWPWYTETGAEAARRGNLSLGSTGPQAIDGYMSDYGFRNSHVGHRRWILFPQTDVMGSGDVPGDVVKGYHSSNVLWVLPERIEERPVTRDAFVAWPPRGFVPANLVYSRWSFSYPGADFSEADVSMTRDGSPLTLTLEPLSEERIGDPTLVWVPFGMETTARESWELDEPQESIRVRISRVRIGEAYRDFDYNVEIFDATIVGPEEVPTTLTADAPIIPGVPVEFTTTSRPWAESVQARVCRTQPYTGTLNAEAGLADMVAATSAGYTARQSKRVSEGAHAYHLANPDATLQSLTVAREFIVIGPDPHLSFDSSLSWATENQFAAVQINQGCGMDWETIWEKRGPVQSNQTFETIRIDLAPWMNRSFSLRFIYDAHGGSYYYNTEPEIGWAFDRVVLTGVAQIIGSSLSPEMPPLEPIELTFADTSSTFLQAREFAFGGFPLDWGPLQKVDPRPHLSILTKLNQWVEDPVLGWNFSSGQGWTYVYNMGWIYAERWPWFYTGKGWFVYLSGSVSSTLWMYHQEYGNAYTSIHTGNWFQHEPFTEADWKEFGQ